MERACTEGHSSEEMGGNEEEEEKMQGERRGSYGREGVGSRGKKKLLTTLRAPSLPLLLLIITFPGKEYARINKETSNDLCISLSLSYMNAHAPYRIRFSCRGTRSDQTDETTPQDPSHVLAIGCVNKKKDTLDKDII